MDLKKQDGLGLEDHEMRSVRASFYWSLAVMVARAMTRRASVMAVFLGASALLGDGAMGGERREELVAGLRAGGAEVKFLGRRGVLDGWLVSPRGRSPYTLYVDETGHGVMGLLFAPEGRELTGRQVAAVREGAERVPGDVRAPASPAVPKVEPPKTRASRVEAGEDRGGSAPAPRAGLLEAALAVEGFDLGQTGPQVAIFADPTCLPSRAAVAGLARRALGGEIRLRVVPVGARGAEAEAMAELVLGSEKRAMTWFTLDRNDEWPELGAHAAAGVALNRRLFERTGSGFVPYALMQRADGGVSSVVGTDFTAWFGEGTFR